MSSPTVPTPPLAGMPEPRSIITVLTLEPPVSRAAGAAPPVTYRVLRTDEQDAYDEPLPAATRAAEAFDTRALDQAAGSAFGGTSRKAAKISIVDAETEVFTDLSDLMASLPDESKLKHHHPPIQTGPRSNRVALERRNVRVRAFLYAASREEDNDFHLIIGRDPNETPLLCMTMELSGTPPTSSRHFATLQAAREAFKAFFATRPDGLPGLTYDFYVPRIPVEIEGSLFFDMSHASGSRPGPKTLKPFMPVVWEVHPISRIVMEP